MHRRLLVTCQHRIGVLSFLWKKGSFQVSLNYIKSPAVLSIHFEIDNVILLKYSVSVSPSLGFIITRSSNDFLFYFYTEVT